MHHQETMWNVVSVWSSLHHYPFLYAPLSPEPHSNSHHEPLDFSNDTIENNRGRWLGEIFFSTSMMPSSLTFILISWRNLEGERSHFFTVVNIGGKCHAISLLYASHKKRCCSNGNEKWVPLSMQWDTSDSYNVGPYNHLGAKYSTRIFHINCHFV